MNSTLGDKLFLTSDGRRVIAQKPNTPILVAVAGMLVRFVLNGAPEPVVIALSSIVSGALLYFAYLEIFQGVNLFRNLLGWVVLSATLFLLFKPLIESVL